MERKPMNRSQLPITADDVFTETVYHMVTSGSRIETAKDTSWEVVPYVTGMANPLARIVNNPHRRLPIVSAVARFVWMIAGSDRLEDIAFYEDKVRGYTDDGLVVPGSSYGARLFNPMPGLNQIDAAIARLMTNQDTRQAMAVVAHPRDVVRESRDIPCEFGMFFHIRDGGLVMTNVMRSNNAFRLLPFNLFEFSMLGEVVAASVGVPFNRYVHIAASMHVYENEFEWDTTKLVADEPAADSIEMPPMPEGNAYLQARALARLEAQLRHTYLEMDFYNLVSKANRDLEPYWRDLFYVLAAYNAMRRGYNWRELLRHNWLHSLIEHDIERKIRSNRKEVETARLYSEHLRKNEGANPYATIEE